MSVVPAAHGLTLFVAPTGRTELDEAVKKAAAAAVPDVATSSQQAAAARPAASGSSSSSSSSAGLMQDSSSDIGPVDSGVSQPRPLTPLLLTPYDLIKESNEQRIINLNNQLRRAFAEQHHQQVVDLFDSLITKGLAAAEEQRQRQQKRQQQQQQQTLATLPWQYRPDHETIGLYCRSLMWCVGSMHLWSLNHCCLIGAAAMEGEILQDCV
jgi:hypothetical protein